MSHIFADRVADTTSTVGTGALALDDAVLRGYRRFRDVMSDGDTIYYSIQHRRLAQWEVGTATYGAGTNALARTSVLASSNANSAVTFSSGAKDVMAGIPAYLLTNMYAIINGGIRRRLLSSTSYYVNGSTGSDTIYDGSAASSSGGTGPFATIQKAVDTIHSNVDCSGFAPTVHVADGTYSAGATLLDRVVGNVEIVIRGNTSTPANCIISVGNAGTCFFAKDDGVFDVDGFTLQGGTGAIGLHSGQFGIIDCGANMRFGAMASGIHIQIDQNASFNALGSYAIVGNAATHIGITTGAVGDFSNATAVSIGSARAFTTFLDISYGAKGKFGTFGVTGAGVAGTTGRRWLVQGGSSLQTSGNDPDTIFPGNTNGIHVFSGLDHANADLYSRNGTAIATNATKGFLYVPYCLGTPTGTPALLAAGAAPIIIDANANKLYFYSGGSWRDAGP